MCMQFSHTSTSREGLNLQRMSWMTRKLIKFQCLKGEGERRGGEERGRESVRLRVSVRLRARVRLRVWEGEGEGKWQIKGPRLFVIVPTSSKPYCLQYARSMYLSLLIN